MKMDAKEVRIFRDRWKAVEEFEIEEIRRMSLGERFGRVVLATNLMRALGFRLARTPEEEREIKKIRERWVRLKKGSSHGRRARS
jgi:hypothetical protein